MRTATAVVTEVGTPGRPLGIDADVHFDEVAVEFAPGATLVLYTDGVTEARDDAGARVRRGPAAPGAGGLPSGDAGRAVDVVAAAVEEQLLGSPHEADDLAVLALAYPS